MNKMEKIKCPQCGQTLIFINYIDGEIYYCYGEKM